MDCRDEGMLTPQFIVSLTVRDTCRHTVVTVAVLQDEKVRKTL